MVDHRVGVEPVGAEVALGTASLAQVALRFHRDVGSLSTGVRRLTPGIREAKEEEAPWRRPIHGSDVEP